MSHTESVFDDFTNLYSLSKTLRFELKPIGKTLENMREQLKYDETLQTFMIDQDIENAYQTLKPLIDQLHEEFITDALSSDIAKKIDIGSYFNVYSSKENLDNEEKRLRSEVSAAFLQASELWKTGKYKHFGWKKGGKVAEGPDILTTPDVLELVKVKQKNNTEIARMIDETFKGFFTYFGGYHQNRENYYETKSEKATAVATRVVHDNLPKFCDNVIVYEERKAEYQRMYDTLLKARRDLVHKDKTAVSRPTFDMLSIVKFSHYLTQADIESYNACIGDLNYLVNLYNQLHSDIKDFKKLKPFKTLFKQIGCGKKDPLFFTLTHDTKEKAEKNVEKYQKPFSVEQVFELIKKAADTYFCGNSNDEVINTVTELKNYLLTLTSFKGIYWSKNAVNTISNRYFVNWETLKEKLKGKREAVSFDAKREEKIKLNDAVELSALFEVLDQEQNWQTLGSLFKKSILEKVPESGENSAENELVNARQRVFNRATNPSRALLEMIFVDMNWHIDEFFDQIGTVQNLNTYSTDTSKKIIKQCMDHALSVHQMIKYFLVSEGKIKGAILDPKLAEGVKTLAFAEDAKWFTWYDAVRNYLTKKPEDDAKRNKLKLNFESSSLLSGWSDGQEKVKKGVLLMDNNVYYLGILRKNSLFDTEKENNSIYSQKKTGSGRLILANLKFQTLAGKGFLGEFKESYGTMGQRDPQKAIVCLQKIIRDRYQDKHPLLAPIASHEYVDKKIFDSDIQEALKECYVCKFTPIHWTTVNNHVDAGDLYLFQINTKDFGDKSKGKQNLQTMYWGSLFAEQSPHQLNGGAEIFYRRPAIGVKKLKRIKTLNPGAIEHKRFTTNSELAKSELDSRQGTSVVVNDPQTEGKSFFFHCPIKANYKSKNYSKPKYAVPEINKKIQVALDHSLFLGIDRGEKHLAYYSLVDADGCLKSQGTLNIPLLDQHGNPRSVKRTKYFRSPTTHKWDSREVDCHDYNEILDAMASHREMARENWQTIGTIKELKEGYISQVVRKIADLATKDNALSFIVLEDLNIGFKRGRQKIEKSIYQKLELALAKKLNFLVDKNAPLGEIGSVTRAIQLTPPVTNFGDMEGCKQFGIMLYTRANYTSQTDPVTGWRKTIYLKPGSESDIKTQFESSFNEIRFDGKDYYFEYKDGHTGKIWQLFSGINGRSLDRYRSKRGGDKFTWDIEKLNVHDILFKIFDGFDYSVSLLTQLKAGKAPNKIDDKRTGWESLRFTVDLIQQIRNSDGKGGKDDNFLQSPVRVGDSHFDTRDALPDLPVDADANGAYNIARKGIIMHAHMQTWKAKGEPKYDKDSSDLSLYVPDIEWDLYLTQPKRWREMLPLFSSRKAMQEEAKSKERK
jgi:hypothetical protein